MENTHRGRLATFTSSIDASSSLKTVPVRVAPPKAFGSLSSWCKPVAVVAAIAVAGLVETAPAAEQKPTIPIIVKDTTTFFW
jgi:hypothetical protein